MSVIINKISKTLKRIEPEIIYIPFLNDVHTDHQIINKAFQATIKWFRYPFIKTVFMYETLSETEFNFIDEKKFNPNKFIDISKYLEKKLEILKVYKSEFKTPISKEYKLC